MNKQLHLRNIIQKQIRYESHSDFLSKCSRSSVIPNGFKIKWNIQVDATEEELELCRKVKEDASLKLLAISKRACERKALQLQREVEKCCCGVDSVAKEDINVWRNREKVRLDAVKTNKWQSLLELNSAVTSQTCNRIINIAKDGNCFYRCLSHILYGTQFRHETIRNELTDFMYRRKDSYSHLVDGDIERHISNHRFSDGRISSWATEAELQGASDFYKCVLMVTRDREFRTWHRFVNTHSDSSDNQVRVYLLLENHHFSLVLRNNSMRIADTDTKNISGKEQNEHKIDWFENPFSTDSESAQEQVNLHPKENIQHSPIKENIGRRVEKIPNPPQMSNFKSDNVGFINGSSVDVSSEVLKINNFKGKHNKCRKKYRKSKPNQSAKTDKITTVKSNNKEQIGGKRDQETSVVNMSKFPLSEPQISLLEKGLKFVPSKTKVDKVKLLADLSEWERRMRLKEFYFDSEKTDGEEIEEINVQGDQEKFKVKKNSHFTPNSGRDKCLDLYIELVKNDIVNNLKKNNKLNISHEEKEAFYQLLHNDDIVIRPADKGSGVVVLNKVDYIESLENEMSASSSYDRVGNECQEKSLKEVKKLVNKMFKEGSISNDMKQYLIPRYSRPGRLKGNPKIHKPNAPFRTIVSGIGTATEKLAEVAEQELNEFVETSPSYVKDTTDFINKLSLVNESLPDGCILFCFDVAKLYPSIPKIEGVQACKEALESRSNPLIDTENVLKMIQTVLDNNTFSFGASNFIQKEGVAIGSKLGKNFACTYMRKWDEKLLEYENKPYFYKRYIDDGFGIWCGTEKELIEFSKYANSIHQNIKVELRYSKKSIEFLDTIVRVENGVLVTDLYVKPTDKQLYLYNSSCHPPNTKKALAYGLAVRLKRICQKDEDYNRERNQLKRQLRKRGYSGKMIEYQLQKADKLNRSDVLSRNKNNAIKTRCNRVPLVITYSKSLPDIHRIIRKHSSVLYDSERLRNVFSELPMVAYRRDKNLCDTLVHGKTNRIINTSGSVCVDSCEICSIIEDTSVYDTTGQNEFQTVQNVGCRERNVVYAIKCKTCEKIVYVGETEREIRERMKEHLSDVKFNRDKPINTHFSQRNHSRASLSFAVLQRMFDAGKAERQICETIWIKKLKTYKPFGCNSKIENSLFNV